MIFTIQPYKFGAAWVFDDPERGLIKEALVSGTDVLCDILANGRQEFILHFSDKEFPDCDKVTYVKPEFQGSWYFSEKYDLNVWLCSALGLYVNEPPPVIYFATK